MTRRKRKWTAAPWPRKTIVSFGWPCRGFVRVAVGAAGGHLQRAEALAAVGLRAGEPNALFTSVRIRAAIALSEVAGHLVNGETVLG